MAAGDMYTTEQLERIRDTLRSSLGESSSNALENLETRFTPAPDVSEDEEKLEKLRNKDEKKNVDVNRILETGKLGNIRGALEHVRDEPAKQKALIGALLAHKDTKATDMAEALAKVNNRLELVETLAEALTAQKGVNPLIEAMRHATISSKAVTALAKAIAEQGTVNHLIRTIGTAPRDQPDAEIILAMEAMRKGSVEQLLEAINLMDDKSPGIVVLATGIVNRKDVGIEPLVRAMTNSKNNAKASAILALELTKRADVNALVTLLEKYISDDTDAGEILTAKLVQRGLVARSREGILVKACRHMHLDSMAGKILAMGILDLKDLGQLEAGYGRMNGHASGKKLLALGLFKRAGFIKGVRLMGKEYFQMSSLQPELDASLKEIRKRYHWIIREILGEEISEEEAAKVK